MWTPRTRVTAMSDADARDVLRDVSEGERLTLTLDGGDELPGEVQDVQRDRPGEADPRDVKHIRFAADPGVGHTMAVRMDRPRAVVLTRPMFADEAADAGHIPDDEVSDPDAHVGVELGEVVAVERGDGDE